MGKITESFTKADLRSCFKAFQMELANIWPCLLFPGRSGWWVPSAVLLRSCWEYPSSANHAGAASLGCQQRVCHWRGKMGSRSTGKSLSQAEHPTSPSAHGGITFSPFSWIAHGWVGPQTRMVMHWKTENQAGTSLNLQCGILWQHPGAVPLPRELGQTEGVFLLNQG